MAAETETEAEVQNSESAQESGCGAYTSAFRFRCGAGNNNAYFDSVLLRIARLFVKRPCIVLVCTVSIALILTWIGLSQNGYPEFDNPYLGFETRYTSIANRLVTLSNFRYEWNRLQLIENYPGEKITEREWKRRKRREITIGRGVNHLQRFVHDSSVCSNAPVDEYARIAMELEDSSDTFSIEVLSLICYLQKLIEEIPEYAELCEHDDDKECCPFWSLTNYITAFSNKTDCVHLQEYDIARFRLALHTCIQIYDNGTQHADCTFGRPDCPQICHAGGLLHSAYLYTMDNTYVPTNKTQYTMLIPPIPKRNELSLNLHYFLRALQSIEMPSSKLVLAGYDFGGKDSLFREYLISDLIYVVLASMIIFLIVCVYTRSVFVTLISFSVLVLSLGVAYFLYFCVFSINYFPFMNMLVTIVILGIGTDGTLVVSVVWQRLNATTSILNKNDRIDLVYNMLKETTVTLLITTCTTAGAFLASLYSSITTIRCFSIFAATAIIVSFILIYICVPTALILGDLIWSAFHSMLMTAPQTKGRILTKFIQFYQKLQSVEITLPSSAWFSENVKNLSKSLKFWFASFVVLLLVLIWSIVVVSHSPGIQLPSTEQFQLLSDSHPVEVYEREIESHFKDIHTKIGQDDEQKITLYLIWGLRPADTGAGLDPYDNGKLLFDDSFSLTSQASQKWMRKLCKKLQKQNFYDPVSNAVVGANLDACFIESMIAWMKRDCNKPHFLAQQNKSSPGFGSPTSTSGSSYEPCCRVSKFPYEPLVLKKCLGLAARDLYRTPPGFFQPDIAGPKFFPVNMNNYINDFDDEDGEVIDNDGHAQPHEQASTTVPSTQAGGQLATFTLRVKTNVSYSLIYDKMNSFYQNVTTFFDEVMSAHNVPPGLEKGFVISAHWDYYDLQKCLISETWQSLLLSIGLCFVLLWASSLSFTIAFGAVLTIFATVIVTGAILIQLFSWKLGVFEAIAITVAVGLSDFTMHHTIEFTKYKSVVNMASPTFFSAVTTITMGLFMLLFPSVLVYQQIGSFFFVLVVVSWLYSVFLLNPLLLAFDKLSMLFSKLLKGTIFKRNSTNTSSLEVVDVDNGTEIVPCQNGSHHERKDRFITKKRRCEEKTKADLKSPSPKITDDILEDLSMDSKPETSIEIPALVSTNETQVPTIVPSPKPTTENASYSTLIIEKKQNIMMEKWKHLKKVAQETTV